jgi:hypothetical protein
MTKPTNCFFVDLAAIPMPMDDEDERYPAKCFDGMAAGVFVDMWGQDVIIRPEDLAIYVANTKAALASTLDSEGNVVGFPIDAIDHRGGLAAGWIVDVNLAEGRDIIEFTPRWNRAGMDAIEADQVHYFSATFDMVGRTILGGSLTNWPATRDAAHNILLKPIELGSSILTGEVQERMTLGETIRKIVTDVINGLRGNTEQLDEVNLSQGESMTDTITETPAMQTVTVNLSDPMVMAAVEKRAGEIAELKLAQAKRTADIAEFVTRLSAGTGGKAPIIDGEKMTAFLAGLPDPTPAMEIIRAVATTPRIDFTEHGHNRVMTGTQPLPDNLKPILLSWLAAGKSKAEFFTVNAVELGTMEDYNLSEFTEKEAK